MKVYVTNIIWDYNELSITDEQINNLPVRIELEIDTDIVQNGDDIVGLYMMDVDELCDYASCQDFEYSFLGFDVDVTEKITTDTHHQSVKESMWEYEGYNEMSHWDLARHPND